MDCHLSVLFQHYDDCNLREILMDSLDFVFTEETSTKTLSAGSGGYLAGIIISGRNLHSGTPTLAVKVLYKGIHADGSAVTF